MKKFLFLLLALPLLSSKCEKDHGIERPPVVNDSTLTDSLIMVTELAKLPKETTEGLNTFGCLLNGKAYIPSSGGTTNPKISADYLGGRCSVNASLYGRHPETQKTSILKSIYIYMDSSLYGPGVYNYGTSGASFSIRNIVTNCHYYKNETLTGKIIISKLDTAKKILAGKFDFVVYGPDKACDSVVVTDGRFDVKY